MFSIAIGRILGSRLGKSILATLIVLILCVFAFMRLTSVQVVDAGSWQLGPENWPTTVDDTVQDILPRLPVYGKLELKFMKKRDTISLHLETGLWIRNRYGLWHGNQKLILSACGRPCHPDDASGVILNAVWEAIQKQSLLSIITQ